MMCFQDGRANRDSPLPPPASGRWPAAGGEGMQAGPEPFLGDLHRRSTETSSVAAVRAPGRAESSSPVAWECKETGHTGW